MHGKNISQIQKQFSAFFKNCLLKKFQCHKYKNFT